MKERALDALSILAFFMVGIIGLGFLGWLFPLWGVIYILTGFNYFDFVMDILDELLI